MHGHTIVCGDDALGLRIIEELQNAGTNIVVVDSAAALTAADVLAATAVICADDDDDLNLEIALLARELSNEVRVVARLANSVLREAMALGNGPGAILDVADLAAPSVVEALLNRTTHTISAAGIEFVVSGADAPRNGTLREIYGDLAPVGVVHGENSLTPGEVVACPGRDLRVRAGDWTAMIGTPAELAAQRIAPPVSTAPAERRSSLPMRVLNGVRADLKAAGHDVVVIERSESNRYLAAAAELDVPVIFGDATLRQTLEPARIDEATAVAVLTPNGMVNIETGIVLRELLGVRWMRSADHPGVPVVLRVYDRTLGAAVAHRFGFENVRSTVELGAGLGTQ